MAYRTAEAQQRESIEAIILGQNDPMEEQLTAMGIIEQYFENGKTEYKVFNTNEYYEDEEVSTAQVGDAVTKRSGSSWFEHTIIPKEEFESTCEPIQGNNYMRRENIRYWRVGDEIEPEIQKMIYSGDLDINFSNDINFSDTGDKDIILRTKDLVKKTPISGKIILRQNRGNIEVDLISNEQFEKNYARTSKERKNMLMIGPTSDPDSDKNLLTYCAKLGIGVKDAVCFTQTEIDLFSASTVEWIPHDIKKHKVDDTSIDYKKIQFQYAPNTMWKNCDIDKWNEKYDKFNPFYKDIDMPSYHETMYILGEPSNDVAKVFMYNPEYVTACGQLTNGELFYQHYIMCIEGAKLDRQSFSDTPENRKIIANMYYECDIMLDNLIENITDKAINKNIKNIDLLFDGPYKDPKEIVQEWAMSAENRSNVISVMENIQDSQIKGESPEAFIDKLTHDFTVDKCLNTASYCLKDPDKTRFSDLNEAYQYAKALGYKDQAETIKELMDQDGIVEEPVNIILMKNKTNKVECGINTKGNLYLNVNGERKLSSLDTPELRLTMAKEYNKANSEAEQNQKYQHQNMVINKSVRNAPCR